MRPNPVHDAVQFLTAPIWPTAVYWLLLVGGLAVAAMVWQRRPAQRTPHDLGILALRLLVGTMWWEQSLWKIPPNYGGLVFWMQQMVDHATTMLQGNLVRDIVIPNISVFGPLVYGCEVVIGVSLMLGFLTRWGGLVGALLTLNLWLGLYSAPNEWPWTYGFLIIIQLLFVIDPPGRSLGFDALRHRRGARTRDEYDVAAGSDYPSARNSPASDSSTDRQAPEVLRRGR